MSMRTIAFSSSNRNSARPRASSVLPTPGGPLILGLPLRPFDIDLHLLDLLANSLHLLDGLLLGLPAGLERVRFGLQVAEFLFELFETILGGAVGFLLESLALDLQLHDAA